MIYKYNMQYNITYYITSLRVARAMETSCRSPALNFSPPLPTSGRRR